MSTENNYTNEDPQEPILIEFTKAGQGGTVPVAWFSLSKKPDLVKKSNEAMEKAMETIRNMADKVNVNIQKIQNKPSYIEMEFGIKFDAEVGAMEPILIEFTKAGQGGTVPVAWFSLSKKPDLVKKSNEAMEKAMETIRNMADKVNVNIQKIQNKPSYIEMEFGIKFDAEVGAIVAKVTAEGSMKVKLVWNN